MTTNWNAILASGKPVLTVSPSSTLTTGADYGPNTTGTTTVGIQEAINAASAAGGGLVWVLPGSYSPGVGINLASNVDLYFDNCTIDVPSQTNAPNGAFAFGPLVSRCHIHAANATFVGNTSFNVEAFGSNGATFLHFTGECLASNFRGANALVQIYLGGDITVEWRAYTADSLLVYVNGAFRITVRNQIGNYTTDPMYNGVVPGKVDPVFFTTAGTATTACEDIVVEDCYFNIGGVLGYYEGTAHPVQGSACVAVEGGGYTVYRVRISNVTVGNSSSETSQYFCDGVDVGGAANVRIADCHVQSCNVGLSIVSSGVVVENIVATQCGAQGIAIGDPSAGSDGAASNVSLSNCIVWDCGYNQSGTANAGIGIFAWTQNKNEISITGCQSYWDGATGWAQKYGIGIQAMSSYDISNVVVTGGYLAGDTGGGPYSTAGNVGVEFEGVLGLNPQGFAPSSPPSFVSGLKVKNPYPFAVRVYILNPSALSGVTVIVLFDPKGNSFSLFGPTPVGISEYTLDLGGSIQVTASVSGASWAWYGA